MVAAIGLNELEHVLRGSAAQGQLSPVTIAAYHDALVVALEIPDDQSIQQRFVLWRSLKIFTAPDFEGGGVLRNSLQG